MTEKNQILVAFGNLLREVREKAELSQENLALKAGLHRNYIGILERGEQNPSLLVLMKIAKALDVNLSDFLAKMPPNLSEVLV